jgi:hypothetical protein
LTEPYITYGLALWITFAKPYFDYVSPYITYAMPYMGYVTPYIAYRRPYMGYGKHANVPISGHQFCQPRRGLL